MRQQLDISSESQINATMYLAMHSKIASIDDGYTKIDNPTPADVALLIVRPIFGDKQIEIEL